MGAPFGTGLASVPDVADMCPGPVRAKISLSIPARPIGRCVRGGCGPLHCAEAPSIQVGRRASAVLPHRMASHASSSCPPPTHQLDRRLGDPAGVAGTCTEPCPGIGHRFHLDRDLHHPGFQVDQGRRRRLGTQPGFGACPRPLPLLLPACADPWPAAGDAPGSPAAAAEPRGSACLPVCAANPACLGQRAATSTPAVLLIA